MPNGRRRSKHTREARPLSGHHPIAETRGDGEWLVRGIPAERALKAYTCPGCGGIIPPGTAHVVAWPRTPSIGSASAVEERRHWHKHCWQRRR
ncbi:hypothetical protein [Enemella evansiae]|uniref:hypothetical protein n=1 Tax=Enemella evansiae TaxID=2016499 RepID=UPI000B978D5D|nr:hypothetical protein [Enemella evansiae]OYO07462.1 hypothetical protein CGZ98_18580 [Enemella evansiae]TDO93381.1 hypothetical protein C8D81_1164 [Enemella evansiae]